MKKHLISLLLVIAIAITTAGTEIKLSGIQSIDDFVQACSGRHGRHGKVRGYHATRAALAAVSIDADR